MVDRVYLACLVALVCACHPERPGRMPVCGDGVAEGAEPCDGVDLAGQACESLGLRSGSLACTPSCALDTAACLPPTVCGDGVAEGEEACDGSDLGGHTCGSLGYYGGVLSCGAGCAFDLGSCQAAGWCGDGLLNAPAGWPEEVCDDGNAEDWDGCTACQLSEYRVDDWEEEPVAPEYDTRDRDGSVTISPSNDVISLWWYGDYYDYGDGIETWSSPATRLINSMGQVSEHPFAIRVSVGGAGTVMFDQRTVGFGTDINGNVLIAWWTCYSQLKVLEAQWLDTGMIELGERFEVTHEAGSTLCDGEGSLWWPVHLAITGPTRLEVILVSVFYHSGPLPTMYRSEYLLRAPVADGQFDLPLPESFSSHEVDRFPGYRYGMGSSGQGYLLVWSPQTYNQEQEGSVHLRRYSPQGAWLEPDVQVSDELGPGAYYPKVAAWPDGRFLVSYTRLEDPADDTNESHDVFGRLYGSDGLPITGELQLSGDTPGDQGPVEGECTGNIMICDVEAIPHVAPCDGGDFVVFWQGPVSGSAPGDPKGTFGRRFGPDGTPLGPEKLLGSALGREAGIRFDTRVAADSGCERFAAVSANRGPPWDIYVARFDASLDIIGNRPW